MRWSQQMSGRFGASFKSTILSLIDIAGADMGDLDTAFTLMHLSVCDSIILAIDVFTLPGARTRLNVPSAAIQVDDDVPLDVLARLTELLRVEYRIKNKNKIPVPVAVVFTKMDAFFPALHPDNPIVAASPTVPAYDDVDGRAVHEHMLALMSGWNALDIDVHLRLNYVDYRYFAVSALGNEPDYARQQVAPDGVHPHRVEDPVLWLLSKSGKVPLTQRQ
jgi:hypothetical protein